MSRVHRLLLCGLLAAIVSPVPAQLLDGPPPPVVRTSQPATVKPAAGTGALAFDAEAKDYHAKAGEATAPFTFIVTNVSSADVMINRLTTSCGCTVAQLPSQPYKLAPGATVPINVSLDLRNKQGDIVKSVSVDSSAGFKSLLVRAHIPAPTNSPIAQGANNGMGDRARNIQTALADRQAVFKGDCVKCHVEPARGKMGQELYTAACGICHDAEHRAAMVPDLKVPKTPRDLAFWQKWIMEGKAGTMMPAFAAAHGGPLTQEQIDSLTVYLYQNYPKQPPAGVAATAPKLPAPPRITPRPLPAPAPVPVPQPPVNN